MRKKAPRGGIEHKILFAILWVGIVPMALALIIGYAFAHEAQRLSVQQNLSTAAQKTAEGLLLALNARLRAVGTLSRDAEINGALASVAAGQTLGDAGRLKKRLLAEAEKATDGPAVVGLYDVQGNLVLSTSPSPAVSEARLTAWQRAIGEPRFVDFGYVPFEFRYTARIVAPVYHLDTGAPIGYVSEVQGVNSLLRFALMRKASGADTGVGVDVYQVGYGMSGGLILSSFGEDMDGNTPLLDLEAADTRLAERIQAAPERNGASFRLSNYKTGGETLDVLIAYHRLFGWGETYVIVYRPASAVYRNINRGSMLALIGSILVIASFCVVAYRHSQRNIVRPIALLNEGAQIIRQGDLDLKLKIETGDEVEELALSFNSMALALKKNIRQLRESEEEYRSLITAMRDGVCQADRDGRITFINPAGLEILGYEQFDDVVGQNLRDLFLEEVDHARIVDELAERDFTERTRLWMKRRDGQGICVEVSLNRMYDDDRKFIGEEGIFRDVTTSVLLEEEAREHSERIAVISQMARAIGSSLEAGLLNESIAAEMKKLLDFDYASVALLAESGEGREVRQLWPEPGAQGAGEPPKARGVCLDWVLQEGRSFIVDDLREGSVPFTADFPEAIRSCLCAPLHARDKIIGALSLGARRTGAYNRHHLEIIEELTPHVAVSIRNGQLLENLTRSLAEVTRAREDLYEANEKLKTLDETKTNLLSNVSHELRTPLVSVMGYTDMILHGKAGPINDTQREYLDISLRNVERLVTLIENLLDFSRLHRGAEEMSFDTFDLREAARNSLQIVKPVADGREIRLELIAPEEPVLVDGDKGKIGQVFNNLLSNAVKFNRNGGSVAIELRPGDVSVDVAVRDTGVGIPSEALDKVFTRFYQVDDSSTRKYGGTGIGLAIAQDIIRMHGDRISVSSELGKGSVFRFSLMLAKSRYGEGRPAPEAAHAMAETHLVIELVTEDRALSGHVRNILLSEGLDVINATGPDHAVALAQKYHPDCIIVDTGTDGGSIGVLDRLLAEDAAIQRPIMIIASDEEVYDRYRTRVAARVTRGFRKSGLLSGIHHAIGGELPAAHGVGGKILCVDDDGEILVFMRRCLEGDGYAVECCYSAEEALRCIETGEYSTVLLDIAMPGMDGWDACRRIKSHSRLHHVKVYLVTAKPITSSLPLVEECGADGYLLKPFKPEDLLALVQGFDTDLMPDLA
ncbi:MAG TPA: response regulator [Candidatus Hydrogenedentes bacterium]|nr:response regulator [Candidatus Hydrogenedentota bacterium]HPG65481.1 response regulator [Candidatus Hydrogenedentota bacterium]